MCAQRTTAKEQYAPSGSHRIGLAKVVEGEFSPTDFQVAPGEPDRKFIADQPGRILVLEDSAIRNEPFLDVRERVVDMYWGHDERGLVGLAFNPNFETNRRFFVRYSAPPNDETPDDWDHTEVLAEFKALEDEPRADPSSERRVLEMSHPWFAHNAGQIAFGPDGYLYMAMGDGGGEGDKGRGHVEGGNGQDITQNLMGAISRIDVDADVEEPYAIPEEPPDVVVSGFGPKTADAAGELGNGFIATSAKPKLVERYERSGGDGSRYGGTMVSWAESEDEAKTNAYEWLPNTAVKGGGQELPTPKHFEQAVQMVSKEDVAKSVVTGNDPQEYLDKIQKYVNASFDHVYLHQTGPNQEEFVDFAEREILPEF